MANFALKSSNLPFFFPKFPKFAIFLPPPPLAQNLILFNRCGSAPHNSYPQASGGRVDRDTGCQNGLGFGPAGEEGSGGVFMVLFTVF